MYPKLHVVETHNRNPIWKYMSPPRNVITKKKKKKKVGEKKFSFDD